MEYYNRFMEILCMSFFRLGLMRWKIKELEEVSSLKTFAIANK